MRGVGRVRHRTDLPAGAFRPVYAAYGGVFVLLSLAWGRAIDGVRPDRFDVVGGMVCVIGVAGIMYSPR